MKQRQIFLRDILTILFKRKFLIVSFAILVFAAAFVGNYVWPPTYESVAGIRLMRGREVYQTDPTVIKSSQGIAMVQMSQQDVNSEMELIRSRDVLEQTAIVMGLDKKLPVPASLARKVYRQVKQAYYELQYLLKLKSRPEPIQAAISLLDEAIEVEPLRDSFMVEISCRLGEPNLAKAVLDNLLDVYTKYRVKLFANTKSSPFFQEQQVRVEGLLGEAQKALKEFREANEVASLDIERELLLQEYADVKKLLVQLSESETAAEAAAGENTDTSIIETLSRKTDSPVVTEMQMRLLELLNDRNRMKQNLGPKHPDIIGVNRQIAEAETRLKEAIQTTRSVAERKAADAEARLSQLNDLMASLENLEREVRIQAASLEYYSEKLEESRVNDAMAEAEISNVKIASTPTLPVDPVRPRKMLNLAFGLIAGLIGGLALAFFFEYLDHGIKTPEDIECYVDTPPLASFFGKGKPDAREAQRLSTVIDVLNVEKPAQIIEVTSSVGGEGAQDVARALAEAYAIGDSSTLLVDLIGGATGKKGVTGGKQGLVDVLMGQVDVDQVIAAQGSLHILGRGSYGECPAHVWSSEPMQRVLQDFRSRYDHVVFLVGPVLQSPDTLRLARVGDGVLIVIRADSTRREVVQRAVEMLKDAKANVLGGVMTQRKQVIPKMIYRRI